MVEQGIGTLDVFVFSAAGMVKMDLRGLCDPYVTVTVANSDGVGGKTKRTKHIRQNLNPEYNDAFSFPVHNLAQILVVSWCLLSRKQPSKRASAAPLPHARLPNTSTHDGHTVAQIKVYDHDDLGADDLMGSRSIPMQEIVEQDWQVRGTGG